MGADNGMENTWGKRIAYAFGLAYGVLLPQFYLVYNTDNRYSMGWSGPHLCGIISALLFMGFVCLLILYLLRLLETWAPTKWSLALRFENTLAGIVVLRMIMSLLDKSGILAPHIVTAWTNHGVNVAVYGCLAVFLLIWGGFLFKRFTQIVLFPAFLLFLFVSWTWSTYGWSDGEPAMASERYAASANREGAANSLYIIFLDEWSYVRTFEEHALVDKMPHLRGLLSEATLYTKAQSCGSSTAISIPRFMYSPDPEVRPLSYDEVRQLTQYNQWIGKNYTSIFDLSDTHYSALLGFFLYYPSIIGSRIDYCGRFNVEPRWHIYLSTLGNMLRPVLALSRYLGIQAEFLQNRVAAFDVNFLETKRATKERLEQLFDALPDKHISLLHLCYPHGPYYYHADGTSRETELGARASDIEAYLNNVVYTDRLIGEIVDAIKSRGEYDTSMIILTSDHSWRYDPDRMLNEEYEALIADDELAFSTVRHVPLIVKHPRQRRSREIDVPVHLCDLHRLFAAFLGSSTNTVDYIWYD